MPPPALLTVPMTHVFRRTAWRHPRPETPSHRLGRLPCLLHCGVTALAALYRSALPSFPSQYHPLPFSSTTLLALVDADCCAWQAQRDANHARNIRPYLQRLDGWPEAQDMLRLAQGMFELHVSRFS